MFSYIRNLIPVAVTEIPDQANTIKTTPATQTHALAVPHQSIPTPKRPSFITRAVHKLEQLYIQRAGYKLKQLTNEIIDHNRFRSSTDQDFEAQFQSILTQSGPKITGQALMELLRNSSSEFFIQHLIGLVEQMGPHSRAILAELIEKHAQDQTQPGPWIALHAARSLVKKNDPQARRLLAESTANLWTTDPVHPIATPDDTVERDVKVVHQDIHMAMAQAFLQDRDTYYEKIHRLTAYQNSYPYLTVAIVQKTSFALIQYHVQRGEEPPEELVAICVSTFRKRYDGQILSELPLLVDRQGQLSKEDNPALRELTAILAEVQDKKGSRLFGKTVQAALDHYQSQRPVNVPPTQQLPEAV